MNLQPAHPNPTTIAVLRALQLGDMLCAVPAFRSLKAGFPNARVSLIGLPWAAELVRRFSAYLDDFIPFPGLPGFPEQPVDLAAVPGFLQRMQERRFDLAIQMQGSGGVANTIVGLMGARRTAGYCLPGQYCPDPATYLRYPVLEPEPRRHVRLIEHLGCPNLGEELEFPIWVADREESAALLAELNLGGDALVLLHPGASVAERRWPAERFAAVGDALAGLGYRVAITGSHAERELAQQVASTMREPAANLAGRTSLGGLAALLERSRLLVSNDTGVSHLAAAVRATSVVLFSRSDPVRWAPVNRDRHRCVLNALRVETQAVAAVAAEQLRTVQGLYA